MKMKIFVEMKKNEKMKFRKKKRITGSVVTFNIGNF